nr:hypothetical protein [Hyphomicrobium sp.]
MFELATLSIQSGTNEVGADDSVTFPCTERFQDGAIRAIVSLASIDQLLQDAGHVLNRLYAVAQVSEMSFGQPADRVASPLFVAPEIEQFSNLLDWKAEQSCSLDEAKFMDVTRFVCPVAVRLPVDSPEETDALIIADQFDRNTRQSRGVADSEHVRASQRSDWSLPLLETLGSKCQVSSPRGGQSRERKLEVADENTDRSSAERGDLRKAVNKSSVEPGELRTEANSPIPVRILS